MIRASVRPSRTLTDGWTVKTKEVKPMSATLTQVLFTKLAAAPRAFLVSAEGQQLIAKATALIREKEGEVEARHFANLMMVSEVID